MSTSPVSSPGPRAPAPPERPIRVMWLVKGLGPGGAEKLLTLSARRRDRSALSCEVVYLLRHKDALVAEIESEGVGTTCLGVSRGSDLRWLARLRRRLVSSPVDVVHAHSPLVAIGARLVLRTMPRRIRPPMVTTEHNVWQSHHPVTRWADNLTFGFDKAHLAVSGAVRDSLPPSLVDDVEVVIHGVDVEAVAALADREGMRRELGIGPDELVVGTVANLRGPKAYPDLLAAARRVLDERPDVRFVAVGQGPLEDQIRRLHAELGLDDRFLLLGYRTDAVRVLSGYDIFCLASHHEGLPVALMEALVIGMPIVATAVGGVAEVVSDGEEGVLVPPAQPDRLADALLDLARDPHRRAAMATAARDRGVALSVDASVRRNEAIYRWLARP